MLKENFVRNNRLKRGVPSDSAISPSVAAKSLSYGEILPKPNPECHLLVHKNALGELCTIWRDLLSTPSAACSQFSPMIWALVPRDFRK